MNEALKTIYHYAQVDNWRGSLITEESNKVHATVRQALNVMNNVLTSPNASAEDKAWAKSRIDQIIKSL